MMKSRSITGDIAVPQKSFEVSICLEKSWRHFNSPVFFNVGVDLKPQASACFILGLADSLDAILEQARIEGLVFSKGGR